jgi:hypothetical protein
MGLFLSASACGGGGENGGSKGDTTGLDAPPGKAVVTGTVTLNGDPATADVELDALDLGSPRGEDVPSTTVPDGSFRLLAEPGSYRFFAMVVVVYVPKLPYIDPLGRRPCDAFAEGYDTNNVSNLPYSSTKKKVDSIQASAGVDIDLVAGKQYAVDVEFDCEGKNITQPSP